MYSGMNSPPYIRHLSEGNKNELRYIHSQLEECQRDYDKILETTNRNGEALKEIKRDINNMREQQQQTMLERQCQMINLQNDMIEFQNKMNQNFFERQQQMIDLQNKLNNLRH